jgi:hypothetical protein
MSVINGLGRLGAASLPTSISTGVGSLAKAAPKLLPSTKLGALGGLPTLQKASNSPSPTASRIGSAKLPRSSGIGSNFASTMLGGAAPTASSLGTSGVGSKILGALPSAAAPLLDTAATGIQTAVGMTSAAANTGAQIAMQLEVSKLNQTMDMVQALTSLENKGSQGIANAAAGH